LVALIAADGPTLQPFVVRTRVRTFQPKPADIQRVWHVVDADGVVLGRLASEVATLLRGKHKPIWAPHVDTGDHVIVVNAAMLDISVRKAEGKLYRRHSGYPGGLRAESLDHLLARSPDEVVRRAVRGMLPKGPLGRRMLKKLKVYAGPTHPHSAQQPQPRELAARRRGDVRLGRPSRQETPLEASTKT
jgi:large subunit ribosomal protein L13